MILREKCMDELNGEVRGLNNLKIKNTMKRRLTHLNVKNCKEEREIEIFVRKTSNNTK